MRSFWNTESTINHLTLLLLAATVSLGVALAARDARASCLKKPVDPDCCDLKEVPEEFAAQMKITPQGKFLDPNGQLLGSDSKETMLVLPGGAKILIPRQN